jgi:hypothetical protein
MAWEHESAFPRMTVIIVGTMSQPLCMPAEWRLRSNLARQLVRMGTIPFGMRLFASKIQPPAS